MSLVSDERVEELLEKEAQLGRTMAAFLKYLQTENRCERTGQPCRDPKQCGCDQELAEYISGTQP